MNNLSLWRLFEIQEKPTIVILMIVEFQRIHEWDKTLVFTFAFAAFVSDRLSLGTSCLTTAIDKIEL